MVSNQKYKKPHTITKISLLLQLQIVQSFDFSTPPPPKPPWWSKVSDNLKKFGFGNHMHFSTTEHFKYVIQQTQL